MLKNELVNGYFWVETDEGGDIVKAGTMLEAIEKIAGTKELEEITKDENYCTYAKKEGGNALFAESVKFYRARTIICKN